MKALQRRVFHSVHGALVLALLLVFSSCGEAAPIDQSAEAEGEVAEQETFSSVSIKERGFIRLAASYSDLWVTQQGGNRRGPWFQMMETWTQDMGLRSQWYRVNPGELAQALVSERSDLGSPEYLASDRFGEYSYSQPLVYDSIVIVIEGDAPKARGPLYLRSGWAFSSWLDFLDTQDFNLETVPGTHNLPGRYVMTGMEYLHRLDDGQRITIEQIIAPAVIPIGVPAHPNNQSLLRSFDGWVLYQKMSGALASLLRQWNMGRVLGITAGRVLDEEG